MLERQTPRALFIASIAILISACTCHTNKKKAPHATPHVAVPTTHRQATTRADPALRSRSLLQLVFSLTRAPKDARGRPRWIGCQLHLLTSKKVPLQVAVDLGDARRRTFFPRQATYERHPMIFPYAGDPTQLRVELHTTLPGSASLHRAPGVWGKRAATFFLPPTPKEGFAFSCVVRRAQGGGTAIDGYFKDHTPRLNGSRRVSAADLAPKAMQAYLRRIL